MSKRIKLILKLIYPIIVVGYLFLILISASEWNLWDYVWLPGIVGLPLLGLYPICVSVTQGPSSFFQYFICAISVLGAISFAITVILLCAFLLFILFGCPFYVTFILYDIYPSYVTSVLGFYLFAIQIILALLLAIKFTTFYRLIVALRKMVLLLAMISSLYPCVVSTLLLWNMVGGNDHLFDLALWSSFDCLLWMITCVVFVHKLGMVDLYGNRYVLFLRSFTNDDADLFKKIVLKHREPIMKIGNPTFFLGKDSLMLSSANWKHYLDYYISRAKVVYVDISNSQGLLWETFEHQSYMTKFIYVVRGKSRLLELMSSSDVKKYENSHLYTLFMSILSKSNIPDVFSFTNDGKIFFSVLPEKQNPDYKIDVESYSFSESNNIRRCESMIFKFRDIKRYLTQKSVELAKYGILGSGSVIVFSIWLLCFIVGVGIIISCAIELFYDFAELRLPPFERILMSLFGLALGVKTLKSCINIIKGE